MEQKKKHPQVKLLLIGDTCVGKSSLLLQYTSKSFQETFMMTIGVEYRVNVVEIEGKQYTLQIWDTAGQERFRSITNAYYRGAQGVMLVYDVTNRKTFEQVGQWMKNIKERAAENVCKILIANKCDLEEERKVSTYEGKDLAEQFGVPFMETSAKTGENVDESFLMLARMVIEAGIVPSQETKSSAVSLSKGTEREKKKKKDKCC
eukprot:TRINITY_DN2714_c0_g1_i1.p1 TRINITY_DN2714_c0_g1~~TRINITY_DN2714_c0_g1_i1.p1  ORF type:complete len:205 (+),score=50.60 TRINITY_DN2714_c0_g1_i1:84-698(+)